MDQKNLDPLVQLEAGQTSVGKTYFVYGSPRFALQLFSLLDVLLFCSTGRRAVHLSANRNENHRRLIQVAEFFSLKDHVYKNAFFVSPEGAEPFIDLVEIVRRLRPSLVVYDDAGFEQRLMSYYYPRFRLGFSHLLANALAGLHSVAAAQGITMLFTTGSQERHKPAGYSVFSYFSDTVLEFGTTYGRKWLNITDDKGSKRLFYNLNRFCFSVAHPE